MNSSDMRGRGPGGEYPPFAGSPGRRHGDALEWLSNRYTAVVAALILVSTMQAALTLDHYPDLQHDEAYFAQSAHSLATDGTLRQPGYHVGGRQEYELYPFVVPLALTAVFEVAPDAGPATLRLTSVLAAALALLALLLTLHRSALSPWAGLLLMALVIVDPLFFMHQRTVRPEIWVTGLVLLAAAALADRESSLGAPIIAGASLGLAGSTHWVAVAPYVGILVAWIYYRGVRWRELMVLHGAMLVLFLPYLVHIVTTPDWLRRYQLFFGASTRAGQIVGDSSGVAGWLFHRVRVELARWGSLLALPYRAHYLLMPPLLLVAAWKAPRVGRAFALAAFSAYVVIALVAPEHWRYMGPLIPLVYLAAVGAITGMKKRVGHFALSGTLVVIVLFTGALDGAVLFMHRNQSVSAQVDAVAGIPEDVGLVIAESRFWFAYRDRPFLSSFSEIEALERARPGFIWITRDVWEGLQRESEASEFTEKERWLRSWYIETLHLPSQTVEAVVRAGGTEYVGLRPGPET